MSPLSSVLMGSSWNLGELISCFIVHMTPIFVYCPPSNGGALLIVDTKLTGSGGFGESFWVGKDLKVLILSVIDTSIALNYSVNVVIFLSEYCLLDILSRLLASISACMMMKCS